MAPLRTSLLQTRLIVGVLVMQDLIVVGAIIGLTLATLVYIALADRA